MFIFGEHSVTELDLLADVFRQHFFFLECGVCLFAELCWRMSFYSVSSLA